MIRELLKSMFRDHSTLQETAERLGLEIRELKGRIEMLLHMDYIRKVAVPAGDCGSTCCGCSIHENCKDESEAEEKLIWGFELTEKGERLLDKKGKKGGVWRIIRDVRK